MQTFEKSSSPELLNKFLDIAHKSSWVCAIKVCSGGGAIYIIYKIIAKDNLNIANFGGATHIIGKIIAKDNLNIANLKQTFENFFLQDY